MYDSHVHYDHKRFDCGRYELLNKMHAEGLDYHRFKPDDEPEYVVRIIERQKVWFRKLIKISIDMNLPLILHVRNAKEVTDNALS